jgi:aryl-alcohol dehydrogenase-like predicted oxidoreductase
MINKIILGTVQLGLNYGINNKSGKPSLENAFEILHTAHDNGIRILDTAEAYGDSQEVIGEFQKSNPSKKFKIITKLNANMALKQNDLIDIIKQNCETLNTNSLYGYMFHNYQSFIENKSFYKDLVVAKEMGLIENIGISLYSNEEILDIIKNYKEFKIIQTPFNLLDNESKRKSILLEAKSKGIEVHTRSAFLQGLFFMPQSKLPIKLKELKKDLNTLELLKKDYNISTEELALKYVLEKDYIDNVLIGVENVPQLITNINICKSNQVIPHSIIDNIDIKDNNLINPSKW